MAIAVLGPLVVDGDDAALGPRDRVVLEVLALRPGDAVSAERLADAMWGDVAPPTWHKVVQGCVVRLRKVLGAAAIETSPAGYRLTTPADEVDSHRFERMVRRSLELLALGEHDRAAYVSGEALALWRGPALRELEGWEAGLVEAGRLDELRLDAEEVHLDARLRAGRYREVLGEAQARVAEAPLRERRWALLALAHYQAGRQGDALRTLHQARTVLVRELGIEPGPDLVALEQAILRQDPSLVATVALTEGVAACPYLGLVPYDIDDDDGFFGRDDEVEACLSRLATAGVLAVVGPSGSGKSSLVRAGVAAALQRHGRRVVVITPGARPLDALTALPSSGSPCVLVVDQCEEAATLCEDHAEQAGFFAALIGHAERAPLVIALRADRLGELSAHRDFARLVEPGLHLLSAMGEDDLRAAIEGPARQAGLMLEPGLVDLLIREVAGEPGALPLLSHALHETWQRREGRTLTVEGYQQTGGIRGSVAQSAEEVYGQIPEEQRPVLRDLLLRLVTPTPEGEPVCTRVPRRIVVPDAEHEQLIELLVRARLVTSDDHTVELAHESLARSWPRLRSWLDDDVEGQRILRHLALTADAWDDMGRLDSELYRGLRLAQAVDWQARAQPALTPAEQAFLDTSADRERAENRAIEDRVREQARQNRRLRTLLVAMAVTVAGALVAGAAALVQSGRVADQRDQTVRQSAVRALVSQANSIRDTQRDLAALLAIEANRLDPGPAGRSALFGTFTRDPGFEGHVPVRDMASGVLSGVVELDGRRAMVSGSDGVVHVVDLERRTDTGERFPDPGFTGPSESRLALSADGSLLAQISGSRGDIDTGDSWLVLYDVGTRTFRVPPVRLGAAVDHLAISPDGQLVAVAGGARADTFIHGADNGILLGTIPGLPEPEFDLLNTAAVAFDPAGHLFVSSKAGVVRIFDPATLEQIGELPSPAEPGGATRQLAFTSDGQILVGTSETGSAAAWNVKGRTLRWSGGVGECLSMAIGPSPNGRLYCGKPDGRVIPVELVSGQPLGQELDTQLGREVTVTLTPDGARLLLTDADRPQVGLWRVDGGGPIQRVIAPQSEPTAYSPDGRVLLVQPRDDGAQLWDPTAGTVVNALERVSTALFFVSSERLGAGLKDGSRGVYDFRADRMVWSRRSEQAVQGAEPDVGGDRLLVWSPEGVHDWFDASTGERVGTELLAGISIGAVAFTADGRRIAVVDLREGLSVFDTVTGEKTAGPVPDTASVRISRDGLLVASTHNGDLLFRDAATLEPVGQTVAAGAALSDAAVEFSGDGSLLLASAVRHAQLFDVATRTPLGGPITRGEPPGSERPAALRTDGAALSPDGKELALTAPGGVALWDLDPNNWVQAACQVAGRNLTQDEWATFIGDLAEYRETCPARP